MTATRTAVPSQFKATAPAATERQLAFIKNLQEQRQLDEDHVVWLANELHNGLTKQRASAIIERLLARPKVAAATTQRQRADTLWDVPAGRYALTEPSDDLNPVRFYRVTIGKSGGRWEGYRFVDRYAGDETYPLRPGKERDRVLTAIAASPLAAAQLYGREEERCCICNRNLTRRLSRELGIGPICGAKHGWVTDEMTSAAEAKIVAQGYDPQETVA